MSETRLRPALVLAVWTFLVWTTRIRNIWTDEELTAIGQVGRTALALAFTAFAVVTVVAYIRARRGSPWSWTSGLIRGFAVWTIGVWVIRAVQIGLADHGVGFKVVHTVLAVVSALLALWADRAANVAPRSEPVRT